MNLSYLKNPKQGVNGVQIRNALEKRFDAWFSVQRKHIKGEGVVMQVIWVDENISHDDIQAYAKINLSNFFGVQEIA